MTLLLFGIPDAFGSYMASGDKLINSSKDFEGWSTLIVFFVILFYALSQSIKVTERSDIGIKSINIISVILSSAIFLSYAAVCYIGFSHTKFEYKFSGTSSYIWNIYICRHSQFLIAVVGNIFFSLNILIAGTYKYYRAKYYKVTRIPINSRGQSERCKLNSEDYNRYFGYKEPRDIFIGACISTIIFPITGLLYLIAAIFHWMNEWYHLIYKIEKEQLNHDEIQIEMQEANSIHNQANQTLAKKYVSID